jgi:hypothetical protein
MRWNSIATPWKCCLREELHNHVQPRFQVVTPAQLLPKMRSSRCVPNSAHKSRIAWRSKKAALVLQRKQRSSLMHSSLKVSIGSGQVEIAHVHRSNVVILTNVEDMRLDKPMNVSHLMEILDRSQRLNGHSECGRSPKNNMRSAHKN